MMPATQIRIWLLAVLLAPLTAFAAAWQSRHNLSPAAYQIAFDDYSRQGYRVNSISGYWAGFGGWSARPMDLLRFLNRVDGRTPPSDLVTTAAHTRMTTGSKRAAGYGFGWLLSGSDRQAHNGCHGSSRSFLVELPDGMSFAVIANTTPNNDDCAGTLKSVVETALGKVSAWPAYDLF